MDEQRKATGDSTSDRAAAGACQKQPYRSPILIDYGSGAKLTRGVRSVTSDSGINKKKSNACL